MNQFEITSSKLGHAAEGRGVESQNLDHQMSQERQLFIDGKIRNLTGQTFGRWVVLSLNSIRVKGWNRVAWWNCKCKCGCEKVVRGNNLTSKMTKSCGCLANEQFTSRITTHGQTGTPTYYAWKRMRVRCGNPKHEKYRFYGGRGITVCERWNSFENFLYDMGEMPFGMTLDRIDSNGNYEPSNCRWATWKTQFENRRKPTFIKRLQIEQ